jgi:hypothetical protein
MRYQARGMASELPSESSEEEGTPSKIHKESHKASILPMFTRFEIGHEAKSMHEARKESAIRGLTKWIVPSKISPLQAPPLGEPDDRR